MSIHKRNKHKKINRQAAKYLYGWLKKSLGKGLMFDIYANRRKVKPHSKYVIFHANKIKVIAKELKLADKLIYEGFKLKHA